jgi:hypothetical protein
MDSLLDKPRQRTRRRRFAWLGALPLLAPHVARTMPWVTLLTGCLVGTGYVAVLAHVADTSHSALGQGIIHLSFLPAIAALAFVLRSPFRPLLQATPVPAWVTSAGQVLLAVPILAVTCWAQLRIVADSIHGRVLSQPATYPLLAQLTCWCAVTVAAAACVDRSRYADLGGAVAVPVSLVLIGIAWYAPVSHKYLAAPPATDHQVIIAWYVIAAAALLVTCLAMRDRWHRYARSVRRIRP